MRPSQPWGLKRAARMRTENADARAPRDSQDYGRVHDLHVAIKRSPRMYARVNSSRLLIRWASKERANKTGERSDLNGRRYRFAGTRSLTARGNSRATRTIETYQAAQLKSYHRREKWPESGGSKAAAAMNFQSDRLIANGGIDGSSASKLLERHRERRRHAKPKDREGRPSRRK